MTTAKTTHDTSAHDISAQAQRDAVLLAALPDVPFDGWSEDLLTRASAKAGIDAATCQLLFPRGVASLLAQFSSWADRSCEAHLQGVDMTALRVRERIALGVRTRLEILTPYKTAAAAALGRYADPRLGIALPHQVWRTADRLWWLAGDTATDWNHYSKRGLLSAVLAATGLYWLSDTSEGHADTWDFLERRLDTVLTVGRSMNTAKTWLGRLRAPFAARRRAGGTALLVLSFLLALSPAIAQAMTCQAPAQPPVVSLTFTPTQPHVTHTLDHAALGRFTTSTTFSHHKSEVFQTGGITESNIRTEFNLSFRQEVRQRDASACLYVDKIDVHMHYNPIVHIASNFPQGSCRFKTTWEHELRHVNTDLITLRERSHMIEAAARTLAPQIAASGPLPESQLPQRQKAIIDQLGKAVEGTLAGIDQLRMQRQQLIDTREEYLRLSRACP